MFIQGHCTTRKLEACALSEAARPADAADKVTGAADYPGDIDLPGQLWMKIVFAGRAACPHPRRGHAGSAPLCRASWPC